MVVEAQEASRSEIVNSIVERFGIERTGEEIQGGAVTGSFTGDLQQVLVAIAPNNGYAIAYSEGRPSRITFTINQGASSLQGTAGGSVNTAQSATGPIAYTSDTAEAGGEDEAPTMERIMERQLRGVAAGPQSEPSPRPDSSGGNAAEMTLRAKQQLEALVRAIRQTQP
ncbi:hypothetical protein HK436_22735 [Mesorhizobium sediminum]|nr:hypothetical protein [Mesorhizobium sediminum]